MEIELFPLEKAVVSGHTIYLGADRSAVEKFLGTGERVDHKTYYFESCLCIEYNSCEKVSFIEVSCSSPESSISPIIYGENIAKCDADRVLQILTEKNQGKIDNENGYAYTFYNLNIGIYREITPNDCKELLDELIANGISIENNPDMKADFWKSSHWTSIGIGVKDYYC